MEPSILSGEPAPAVAQPAPLAAKPPAPPAAKPPAPPAAKPPAPSPMTCGTCRESIAAGTGFLDRGRWICRSCVDAAAARATPPEASAASFLPALLGGVVGSLLGAGIFAAIAVVAGVRVGYVAVLVGFLTGAGVRIGARGAFAPGLKRLAAGLAVGGIVASKYMVFAHFATEGIDVSPLSGKLLGFFLDSFPDLLTPFDIVWVVLAAGAAMRAAQGRSR